MQRTFIFLLAVVRHIVLALQSDIKLTHFRKLWSVPTNSYLIMPLALATALRRRVIDAHLKGEPLNAIAERENLSYSSVRNYWRRYRERGFAGLAPDYQHCGRKRVGDDDLIYRATRYLKFRHRQWGAALIQLKLKQRYPDRTLPSVRTMQRWFKKAGLTPLRKQLPKPDKRWAATPHEIWQIDAKERLTLQDGTQASYLTVTDEHSGALLASPVFPLLPHQQSKPTGST